MVEQNFYFASTVADRHHLMERGRVVDMFENEQLDTSMNKLHEYLGRVGHPTRPIKGEEPS